MMFKFNFMKNILIILISYLFLCQSTFAQVSENKLQMSLGVQNSLAVRIPDAKSNLIEKIWKKYTKDYGKLTKNRKADEQILQATTIPSINGANQMDVYVIIEDNGITAFFDLKNGFLNSTDHPNEYKGANEFLQQFSYEVQREMVKEELENQQDELKKLNRKMADLVKDNKDYHQDIEEGKAKILKAENNIITNVKDQELTKTLIGTQTKTVETVQMKLNNIGKKGQ